MVQRCDLAWYHTRITARDARCSSNTPGKISAKSALPCELGKENISLYKWLDPSRLHEQDARTTCLCKRYEETEDGCAY